MSDSLRTVEDYELFLYGLSERLPAVRRSTLALARRGATLARVAGELSFDHGFRSRLQGMVQEIRRVGTDVSQTSGRATLQTVGLSHHHDGGHPRDVLIRGRRLVEPMGVEPTTS